MPSKKKKYNARFPAGRIKKIMQSDEEIGKVAQAVPVIISRTLELFVESLLQKTLKITNARNARTLSPSHLKQCIVSESRFDFLKDLVKNIPDISSVDEGSFDEPPATTSFAINSSDHDLLNNQIARHHLQRSQSLSYAGSQQSHSLAQTPVYKESNQFALKHKLSPNNSNDRPVLPIKICRLNSSPATSTITSSTQQQFLAPPITPGSFKIEIKTPDTSNHSNTSNNFPIQISYCIDSSNKNDNNKPAATNSHNNNIMSTTSIVPTPLPQVTTSTSSTARISMEPLVKIDYSNLTIPMTSTSKNCSPAPLSLSPAPIKIDLSHFNPMTHLQQHQQKQQPQQFSHQDDHQELDENYDDL